MLATKEDDEEVALVDRGRNGKVKDKDVAIGVGPEFSERGNEMAE